MAKQQAKDRTGPEDYLRNVQKNFAGVVNHYGSTNVARWTGVSRQGIDYIKNGNRVPGLDTFLEIGVYLDIEPELWFLPPKDFEVAWASREREPFFAPARNPSRDDSGLVSGQSTDRSRFRDVKKPARSRRTGQGGASIHWRRHNTVRPATSYPTSPKNVPSTTVPRTSGLTSKAA